MRAPLVVLGVALVLLVTACRLDVDVRTNLEADGTGEVVVTAVADAELLAKAPEALGDLRLDDALAGGWMVDGPAATPDGGSRLTLTKPFRTPAEATSILKELNGPQGPLRDIVVAQQRRFAVVESTITGTVQLEGGLAAFADVPFAALLDGKVALADRVTVPLEQALGLRVVAALPGQVTDAPGAVVDGGTATWVAAVDGTSTALTAKAEQVDRGAQSARRTEQLALAGMAVWSAVIVVVGAGWWLRRRRSGSPNPATPPA